MSTQGRGVPPRASDIVASGPEPGQPITCPHCGHQLSMYMELESGRAETAAARIADAVGSWRFLLVLLLFIALWLGINALFEPFRPHPSTMIGYLGTVLTAVTALQGPLILLAQRREAARDHAREVEAFRVATNAEADLHAIRHVLETMDVRPPAHEPPNPPAGTDR